MTRSRALATRIWTHPAGRYAAAIVLALASAGVRLLATPLLGTRAPFTLFYPGIVVAAWFGGTGAGVAALIVSGLLSSFFALPSAGGTPHPGDWVALALFVLLSAFLIAAVETVRRARGAAERAERESRSNAEALQQTLNAARMGHWAWDIGSGQVTWSESLEGVHGMPPGSFGGNLNAFFALIHPEDVAEVREAVDRARTDGTGYDIEFRVVPADGRMRWIRGLGHVVVENGKPVRMTGLGVDVTEPRAREADRRLLAAIIESTDDAILAKDLNGRILSWNPAAERMFGYTSEEAVGKSIEMLLPAERADDVFSILGRIRKGERVDHYETVRRRKDGKLLDVSLTVSPVRDEKGRVIAASKIARDITALRAAERERQRIRDLYLGILGHDLRNPLNTIVASLYVLERKVPPEVGHAIPRITRSAQRMGRMIDQLLDFTRARLGEGLPVNPRPGNLRDICSAVVDELEAQHPGRIRFRAKGQIESDWDADRIAQALSNLIVNALDYGSPTDTVEVELDSDGGDARIEVKNRGPGIPDELRPVIFEPFRRGTGDEQRNRRGLGLGLFITREIVRAHGGSIELGSDPGITAFVVRLPLTAVAQPTR